MTDHSRHAGASHSSSAQIASRLLHLHLLRAVCESHRLPFHVALLNVEYVLTNEVCRDSSFADVQYVSAPSLSRLHFDAALTDARAQLLSSCSCRGFQIKGSISLADKDEGEMDSLLFVVPSLLEKVPGS